MGQTGFQGVKQGDIKCGHFKTITNIDKYTFTFRYRL